MVISTTFFLTFTHFILLFHFIQDPQIDIEDTEVDGISDQSSKSVKDPRTKHDDVPSKNESPTNGQTVPNVDSSPSMKDNHLLTIAFVVSVPVTLLILAVTISIIFASKR